MATIKGDLVLVEAGGNTYTFQTDASADLSADMIDKTTKDSNAYKEFTRGERTGTLTVNGLYDNSTGNGTTDSALQDLIDGTEIAIKWGQFSQVGEQYLSCTALISSVNVTGPKNEMASYTLNLQLTGSFDFETVT